MSRFRVLLSQKVRPWGFGLLSAASLAMLVSGEVYDGYSRDVLINLGTSLLVVALTYAIFDPVFQEFRRSRVIEQPFFDDVRFSRNVQNASSTVRIMDTGNHILEGRQRDRFLEAIRTAAEHGVRIEILLLDPDAKATEQRAEEIRPVDVRGVIVENLRFLYCCRAGMSVAHAENLAVRTYDALPALQLHQWDGRALISFYPVGQRASASPHLEINIDSSLGQFAESRFHELWQHGNTTVLEDWWTTPLVFCRDGEPVAKRAVRYVRMHEAIFIDGGRIADLLVDFGRDHITASGSMGVRPFESDCTYSMSRLSSESEMNGVVTAEFLRKYGDGGAESTPPMLLALEPI
ncbi:hypothetical protein ODJ79_15810 [Actinoplanes sp. KI2]|uniref:hypothetical protein n=1 Tax=Actinoplanes sp. KI2 TaxID=2983315 RepID=UPI0021D5713F|nr:hypothetical protein [Actinoplanes sp. KI2]MCU7725194.1 hypothetical protein [Actinoplanes sp. KI2]